MPLTSTDDCLILEPDCEATAAVIWLHGLGADGNDFVPIVPELNLPENAGVRFIFPHAPMRPITINAGMTMRGWFDILDLGSLSKQDDAGIRDSQARVEGLIAEQLDAGIPISRIVLAGFSQGGAIALHTGLRHREPLAGILALSTFLPLHERVLAERSAENAQVPILMCHGIHDPMLPLQLGSWSRDLLLELGYAPLWKQYPMQHQVCAEEIRDISLWLQERLALQPA